MGEEWWAFAVAQRWPLCFSLGDRRQLFLPAALPRADCYRASTPRSTLSTTQTPSRTRPSVAALASPCASLEDYTPRSAPTAALSTTPCASPLTGTCRSESDRSRRPLDLLDHGPLNLRGHAQLRAPAAVCSEASRRKRRSRPSLSRYRKSRIQRALPARTSFVTAHAPSARGAIAAPLGSRRAPSATFRSRG